MTPDAHMRNLAANIIRLQQAIRELKNDLLAFRDIKQLKALLKELRQQQKMDYLDDCPF